MRDLDSFSLICVDSIRPEELDISDLDRKKYCNTIGLDNHNTNTLK